MCGPGLKRERPPHEDGVIIFLFEGLYQEDSISRWNNRGIRSLKYAEIDLKKIPVKENRKQYHYDDCGSYNDIE